MPSKYGFGDSRSKSAPTYKKSSGFKMKGSPMQRNFGIGSPAHQEKETSHSIGSAKKGESNVGLSTYNAANIGKTLQTNEHMSKRQPTPAKSSPTKFPWAAVIGAAVSLYSGYKNRKQQREIMEADQKRYDDELARQEKLSQKSKVTRKTFNNKIGGWTPPWTGRTV